MATSADDEQVCSMDGHVMSNRKKYLKSSSVSNVLFQQYS